MRTNRCTLAAFILLAAFAPAAAQTTPVPITVQVINDSGMPDEQVYLLLAGKSVTGTAPPGGALPFYPFSASGIVATPVGTVTNVSGSLSTSGFLATSASAPLTVTAEASGIAMSFSPSTVTASQNSTWTIGLPNGAAAPMTLVQPFTATLPQGVTTTSGAATGNGQCTGVTVASSQVTLPTGQSIPAGGCTIAVTVQAAGVSAPATLTATASYLQSAAVQVSPPTAPLTVVANASTLAMGFEPSSIAVGASSTLTIKLPNATGGAVTLSADFIDSLPAGIVVAPVTAGGTCQGATATATQVTLPAGSSLPPGGCSIVVTVTSISTAGPLTGLQKAMGTNQLPLMVTSPYSGIARPVFEFAVSTVSSGNLYLSYQQPVMYPPAPTVTAKYRFQALEFSYSQFIASDGDLSSIDFFGIPLELQTFAAGDKALQFPLDRVTYYTSTGSLLRAFTDVDANLKYAFMRTDGTPYDPATDTLSNFARIVGPNQLAAPGTSPIQWPAAPPSGYTGTWPPGQGSPWPYPSFADYLDQLVAIGYTFVESDTAIISAYNFYYTGTIAGNRTTGYTITLVGADRTDPVITLTLPPQSSSAGGFDFLVYGIPQNCDTLQVSGFTCTSDNVKTLTNSVYGWIQADVMAALNFGYLNGVADVGTQGTGQSSVWYGLPPVQYPFGQARAVNDGFYSPWAALMYNHSDAYGFAFSDRKGRPSPDIAFPVGGTLRVWILPDTRLDAPLPQVTATDHHSITVSWPTVAGADHYQVTWSPPYATAAAVVPQPPAGTATVSNVLTGLTPGTPYTITVRALNADETQASFEIPLYSRTVGTPQALPSTNAQASFGFNWTPPAIMSGQWPDLFIAGTPYTYSPTAGWNAAGSIGIHVGLPPSAAPLTVLPTQACSPPCITPTLSSASIAPGGQTTLTVTISNPSTTGQIKLPHGLNIPMPQGVTAAARSQTTCIGVNVTQSAIVVGAVQISQTSSTCTIDVTLTASTAGTVVIAVPPTNTDEGRAPAASVALTVTGGASAMTQAFDPAVIHHGATSTLTLGLRNDTANALTLTDPLVDVLPAGVTITGIAGTNTCPGVSAPVSGTQITMAAGSAIAPGGCNIAVTVTSSTPGSVVNTSGTLLTNATVYPTRSYPLELRLGDTTIWSANYYLTFVGTPAAFALGPCQPDDTCIGSGQAPTVPFDTLRSPNFLERQGVGLTASGGANGAGPPFGEATPTLGMSFTPVANKKAAAVVYARPAQ